MQSQTRVTLLAGGVGGSRMALGFARTPTVDLTVIVNVADDDEIYGLHVAADLDTVTYRLAGIEGEAGWGRAGDTWAVMEELERFGVDTTFRLGDRDLALNLYRTRRIRDGTPLSTVSADVVEALGVDATVVPVTDDAVRTVVQTEAGEELDFQTYFVRRGHRDRVASVEYRGIDQARPAPGVLDSIVDADLVVLAPSNPILSLLPIIGVPGVRAALSERDRLVAVSPLIDGRAVKGPTVDLLVAAGHPATNAGVVESLGVPVSHLVADTPSTDGAPWVTLVTDTRIDTEPGARRLAREVLDWLG